ncbi:MAG: site-specific integrase [Candidatus Micrarchaeota archaeon]
MKEFCLTLSDNQLKRISKVVNRVRKELYNQDANLSAGVDRTFNSEELKAFFEGLPNEKYRLMFGMQMCLALRISEVVKMRVSDLDLFRRTAIIREPKTGRNMEKTIPIEMFSRLAVYLDKNREAIRLCDNCLWFSDKPPTNKKQAMPHLNENYARKLFRESVVKCGLATAYAVSRDGRPLYRLSSHSLRHNGITEVARAVGGDIFKLQTFSGHTRLDSLQRYVHHATKEELATTLDKIFSAKTDVRKLKEYFE